MVVGGRAGSTRGCLCMQSSSWSTEVAPQISAHTLSDCLNWMASMSAPCWRSQSASAARSAARLAAVAAAADAVPPSGRCWDASQCALAPPSAMLAYSVRPEAAQRAPAPTCKRLNRIIADPKAGVQQATWYQSSSPTSHQLGTADSSACQKRCSAGPAGPAASASHPPHNHLWACGPPCPVKFSLGLTGWRRRDNVGDRGRGTATCSDVAAAAFVQQGRAGCQPI